VRRGDEIGSLAASHIMQIVHPAFRRGKVSYEHDKILRRLLAQRAHEWQSRRGIRRLIARIKIEFWAWRETAREQRRSYKDDSPHNV
jgi:hypothetical protein